MQTATFQHAFKSYTRKFVTMDTGMLQVNKFLDFRLSFPQKSLIVHRKTFSSRQNNRISVIWKEAESKLFNIQKKTTIPNSKALVNKLMPHCLQKRTKLTLPIVFEQTKMLSLSNNVLFYYNFVKDLYLYSTKEAAKIQLRFQNKHETGNLMEACGLARASYFNWRISSQTVNISFGRRRLLSSNINSIYLWMFSRSQ